jgi:hypothetical protein
MRCLFVLSILALLVGPARAQSRLNVDQCPADALAPGDLEGYLQLEDEGPTPDVEVRCAAANDLQIVLRLGERIWTERVWLGDTPRQRWPRVVALAVSELMRSALESQPSPPPPSSLVLTLPPPPSPALVPTAADRTVLRTRFAGFGLVVIGAAAILGGVALFEIVANNEDVLSAIGQGGMALGAVGGAAALVGAGLLSRRLPHERIDREARGSAMRASIGLGALSLASVVGASVLVAEGRATSGPVAIPKLGPAFASFLEAQDERTQQRHKFYSGSVALYGVAALSLIGSSVAAAFVSRQPTRPYAMLTSDRRGLTMGWEGSF